MSFFLLQPRYLRPPLEETSFPGTLKIVVRFGPSDAFGVSNEGPRTTRKRSAPAKVQWNANEGTSRWEGDIIDTIRAELRLGAMAATWLGNSLEMELTVASKKEAEVAIASLGQFLPAFLSFRLMVFVWIQEFTVAIKGAQFRFETAMHRYGITLATTEVNSQRAVQSLRDWATLRQEGIRIVMALYYYRQAERLSVLEPDRQAMAAEVVLNLAKAIEILFTSDRNQIRSRAADWGFDNEFIERWIVPILLIRNELDVAHVVSGPIEGPQHQAILNSLDRAFYHVHTLLEQVLDRYHTGQLVPELPSAFLDKDKVKLLRRIEKYATQP